MSSMAQDIIIFTSGEEVEAKVVEVSDDEVKYKTWGNQSGPTWVKKTTDIFMIRYENGTKQTFTTQPAQQQRSIPQQPQPNYNYNNSYNTQQSSSQIWPTRVIGNSFCIGTKVRGNYNRIIFEPGPQLLDYHGTKWALSYAGYIDYYPKQTKKNGSPFTGIGIEVMYSNRGGTIKKNFDPVPFIFNLQYIELRPSFSLRDNVAYIHIGPELLFVGKATAKWTSAQTPMEVDLKEYEMANYPLLGIWTDFGFYIGRHFTIEFNADIIFTALNDGGSGIVQPIMFESGNTFSFMYSVGVAIGWLFTPMKPQIINN